MTASPEKMRAFAIERGIAMVGEMAVKLLRDGAKAPTYGSARAAGMDLYAAIPEGERIVLSPGGRGIIPCGISIAIPAGTYARVAPRSGLAVKNGIDVLAGVVDEDYRGEVGVVLINHSDTPFEVKMGDRIAQLIIEKYVPVITSVVDDLDTTVRGEQGYGSTGV